MPRCFSIDFVRQALEQTLCIEHNKNNEYFGGKDQVNIFSFYEQVSSQAQVDRFVKMYRDLTEQQNRSGLILNGVLVSPENPTITNLYSCEIIPMSWTCSLRTTVKNRDQSINTINNLINELKGSKADIAELKNKTNYFPFMVGTIGHNDGIPTLRNGDFVGSLANANDLESAIGSLRAKGVIAEKNIINNERVREDYFLYCENNGKLRVVYGKEEEVNVNYTYGPSQLIDDTHVLRQIVLDNVYDTTEIGRIYAQIYISAGGVRVPLDNWTITDEDEQTVDNKMRTIITVEWKLDKPIQEYVSDYEGFSFEYSIVYFNENEYRFLEDDGNYDQIIFPPEHESFKKYKLSMSFDAIRCDEPRNLNGEENVDISFGGSATLVDESVKLGNDLLKVGIATLGIPAEEFIGLNGETSWLEPLEMPSGNSANTNPIQLISNKFKTNSHTDSLALTLQYTFICDRNIELLNDWFYYARYGIQTEISPNIIYRVNEVWCSWGNYENIEIKTKIVENIDIENTESDTLTLSLSMQIQGDNY